MVLYGQIVIGAPGAGKTTYCDGMQQYLKLLGRDCCVVNLDPANEVPYDNTSDNNNGDSDGKEEEEEDQRGNSQLPYDTILDVCQDIISLDSVMSELNLGPNGGLLYCMEYIEHHLGEVIQLLKERLGIPLDGNIQQYASRAYLLFDLPGQIELTAHSNVVTRIAQRLIRELDLRLVCIQLVDGAVCLTDVSKFIGAALVCTSSMMRLELPCVNVLSKMDLLQRNTNFNIGNIKDREKSGNDSSDDDDEHIVHDNNSPLPFNLEFFTQCHDLHRLVDYLESNPMEFMAHSNNNNSGEIDPKFDYTEDPEYQAAQERTRSSKFHSKYRKLHHELCEMVEDYSLLSFLPLSIQDAESVGRVVARVDKCNGYVFLQENGSAGSSGSQNNNNMQSMFSSAIVADSEWSTGVLQDVQEKYLGDSMFREDIAELKSDQNDKIQQKTDKVDESIK